MAAKKNKKTKTDKQRPPTQPVSEESPGAEAVTVAWMLATMATTLAEVLAVVSLAVLSYDGVADSLPQRMDFLPWMALFIAVVTGTVTLILTPLTLRHRRTPPPASVVRLAVFVGAAAWLLALASLFI